jgi:hypothetical protein
VSSGPMDVVSDPERFDGQTDARFIEAVAEKISLRMPAMANAAFGCNGTGFKVAPAVGKALAEHAPGVSSPGQALEALRPDRFLEGAAIFDPYAYADRPQEMTQPPSEA